VPASRNESSLLLNGVILSDLKQTGDLRVLDYDGHHVFYNFSLNEIGKPVYHEA
jgi:hypothetical protein